MGGFSSLTGYAYSVGKISGAQWLYRSELATPTSQTSYYSTYHAAHGCMDNGVGPDGSSLLRPALAVMNLDSLHPPPYRLE